MGRGTGRAHDRRLLARELGQGAEWQREQVEAYRRLAESYMLR
jgi:hypothetical protein